MLTKRHNRERRMRLTAATVLLASFFAPACVSEKKEPPAAAESEPMSFTRDIKPIFDEKCVACHACYDAPGQLDLRSVLGIERGAMKIDTYAAREKPIAPTFAWNSPNTLEDWREMGFFSVLEGGRDSIMGKMLTLGHANPVKANERYPDDVKIDQLERQNHLPNKYEIDGYIAQFPEQGMPLAVSGLTDEEYDAIMTWLEQGAPFDYEAPGATEVELARIQEWEDFLNGKDKRSQLVARYLFEHMFLTTFVFEDTDDANFFQVVRSTTPSGKTPVPVAQHLPNGEVGGDFYYRFLPLDQSRCVKNTRIQVVADPEKLMRFKEFFFEESWDVDDLPGYTDEERFNPMGTFAAIPPKARYRFLLDINDIVNKHIVHGPSCHGNQAIGTVQEHWWNFYESPETSMYVNDPAFRAEVDPLLSMMFNPANLMDAVLMQHQYVERRKQALKNAAARARQTNRRSGLTEIWKGEDENDTPILTVYRHDDNAYALDFAAGDFPKTAWVLDLPVLEHGAYSAYVNYDLFGTVLSSVFAARNVFGLTRVTGELNFLRFLPPDARRPLFESWYRGPLGKARIPALVPTLQPDDSVPTAIEYSSNDPMREFLEKVLDYVGAPAKVADPINRADSGQVAEGVAAALRSIVEASKEREPTWRKFKTFLPEAVFLRIDRPGSEPAVYTMMHVRDYATKGYISMSLQDDIPSNATIAILEGVITGYPNFMFRIDEKDIEEFASALIEADTQDEFTRVVERWGIRRSSPDFWSVLNSVTEYVKRTDPRKAGTFDVNRYKNL